MRSILQAVPALVEALYDDPFYQAITVDYADDAAMRKHALACYLEYSLGEAQRIGRCVVGPQAELGAAAWLLPATADETTRESAAKAAALTNILGRRGEESYHRIVRFMAPLARQVVPAGAWYLSIVGISPVAQGRGVGAALLRPTLEEAAAARAACYLETFTARNLRFYERMGFRNVATHVEPVTASQYCVMLRDA